MVSNGAAGSAGYELAWRGEAGVVWHGMEWHGEAGHGRSGMNRQERCGRDLVRPGKARSGWAQHGRRGAEQRRLCIAATSLFFVVDLAFFTSNMVKLVDGGWFPVFGRLFRNDIVCVYGPPPVTASLPSIERNRFGNVST